MKPKWQKLASLAQEICTLYFQFFGAVFASKGYPFKNILYQPSFANSLSEVLWATISGHNRSTSETPFEWRFAGGLIVAHLCMVSRFCAVLHGCISVSLSIVAVSTFKT